MDPIIKQIGDTTVSLVPVAREPPTVELHFGDKVRLTAATRLLNVSAMTANNWLRSGKLTKFKSGTRTYVPWAEVEALLRSGYGPPTLRAAPKVE